MPAFRVSRGAVLEWKIASSAPGSSGGTLTPGTMRQRRPIVIGRGVRAWVPWSLDTAGSTPVVGDGIGRPASDLVTTGWTATPGAEFWSMLNETTADDANYVTGPVGTSEPLSMTLDETMPAGSHVVRIRAKGNIGSVRAVLLDDSNISVGATSWQPLSSSWTTYSLGVVLTSSATRIRLELQ